MHPAAASRTRRQGVDGGGQRLSQGAQLVVDGYPQRLEGARGGVDALPPPAPACT